jgi:DNA polymerase III subunit delta'
MPFADIIGHDRTIEIFRRSLRAGKMAHAYIFEGQEGTGRRKTALALVQALFCQQLPDDACGLCPSCRKVAAGNHGDIHFVEPLPDKRDISISQLRDIQRELSLRPYEAPRKACIMEPADRMNTNSANSFLKTLEEPPGNAIIILLTENADILLPTIRSRCQLVRFSPLSPEHVCLILEHQGTDRTAASLLAQMSDGSVQKAIGLDNEALSERRESIIKYFTALSLNRIVTVFDASESLSGNRDETIENLDMLLSILRDAVHLSAGNSDIINSSIKPHIEKLASQLNLKKVLEIIDEVLETRRAVQRNANAKLALDHLFMKVASAIS